jgi:hypothetical protein
VRPFSLFSSYLPKLTLPSLAGFWTATRLSKLSLPLSRQIEVPADIATVSTFHTLLSSFSDLLSSHETHLKTLNSSFLHLTRSDDLRVKRGAVEALEQMWEAVGDGMLGLVPETTPFLAEAREETGNGVEAATRRLIKQIELHLGEDLDSYLDAEVRFSFSHPLLSSSGLTCIFFTAVIGHRCLSVCSSIIAVAVDS